MPSVVFVSLYYLQSHNFPRSLLRSIYAYATNFFYEIDDALITLGPSQRYIYKFTDYHKSNSTLDDLCKIEGIKHRVPATVVILEDDFEKLKPWIKE